MGAKACIAFGLIALLLGIFLALAGPLLIPYEIPLKKNEYLVVDSKSSQQYDDWAGGYDVKNEYQMVFYFYNLTNTDDVRQNAAIPNYTTVGPYIYRRYRKAMEVNFQNGGNQVQFLDFRDYQYDMSASGNRSNLDIITNVNPVYFSAVGQAGSEENMLVAALGGYLGNFTDYLTATGTDGFISAYTSMELTSYLSDAVNHKIALINATTTDTYNSTSIFLWIWCNSTGQTDYGNWTGLLLSYSGEPTNITRSSALALLNASEPLSLLSTDPMTAWTWDRALTNDTYRQVLLDQFRLTDAQFEAVWHWRTDAFGPSFMYDDWRARFEVEDIGDLGWIQWTFGTVLGTLASPVSVFDIFPTSELGFYYDIELFAAPVEGSFPSWQFSKKVMDPIRGLENITLYQAFALAYSQQTTDFSYWGLNSTEADLFFGYSFQLGEGIVAQALANIFGPTGGLMLTQSIDDWVFNCNPFLINLLLPNAPSCSILVNHTVFSNITINTGKANISAINEYMSWQGSPKVEGVWAGDLAVEGCTELGQFAPDQEKNGTLATFNDEFVRTMVLDYSDTSSIKGISAYQYVLNYNNIFAPNDFYFQTIPGFTNMTTARQAPIFFSLWDMLYVDEKIRNRVIGLYDNSTELEDNTVIHVEPITGNTIKSQKRLQVNIYSPADCAWCVLQLGQVTAFGNTNFPSNTFFPLAKAGEYIVISDDLASMLRTKLKELKYGPRIGLYVGVSVGPALALLGVLLIVLGCRRNNSSRYYENINDRG